MTTNCQPKRFFLICITLFIFQNALAKNKPTNNNVELNTLSFTTLGGSYTATSVVNNCSEPVSDTIINNCTDTSFTLAFSDDFSDPAVTETKFNFYDPTNNNGHTVAHTITNNYLELRQDVTDANPLAIVNHDFMSASKIKIVCDLYFQAGNNFYMPEIFFFQSGAAAYSTRNIKVRMQTDDYSPNNLCGDNIRPEIQYYDSSTAGCLQGFQRMNSLATATSASFYNQWLNGATIIFDKITGYVSVDINGDGLIDMDGYAPSSLTTSFLNTVAFSPYGWFTGHLMRIRNLNIYVSCSAPYSTTYYVKADATGANDGSSWANAFTDLQYAINTANAGESIFVARGTYKPTRPADNLTTIDSFNRDNAFVLKEGVKIYGGFAGTENTLAERDLSIVANKSILSGDIDNNNVLDNGNAYHVIISSGNVGTAVLDGFTITNGYANNGNGSIEVNGNFISYSSGGGIYIYDASLIIKNCIFSENFAIYGGGMCSSSNSSPIIVNCTFSENSAGWDGGGMRNSSNLTPVFTNCTFSENSAVNNGGGIYNDSYFTSPALTNCTFLMNSADVGGGLCNFFTSSSLTITNCNFSGNTSTSYGGGIANFSSSSHTITNCIFSGNKSNKYGGGIFNYYLSSPIITNCIFSGNDAIQGGGSIYNEEQSNPVLKNCIVFGNKNGITSFNNSTAIITYSLVQGMTADITNHNLDGSTNPLFVNAPSYTTAPFIGGDYHLQPGSPAINAGTPDTTGLNIGNVDLAGNPRIKGTAIDMGALEFQKEFYYSTANNAANVLANWNSEPDGTGTAATSFTDTTRFIVQTGHTLTNSSILDFGKSALFIENNAGINNTGNISVGNTWSNNGTVTSTGVVELNGTEQQNITGIGTVSNLTLNNNAGATIANGSKLSITDTYTPTLGTLHTNGNLVLVSNENTTARVAPVTAGAVTGNITVQRYLSNTRAWRMLTAPVGNAGSFYSQWQNNGTVQAGTGVEVWSPSGGAGIVTGGGAASLYTFNEATQSWATVNNTQAQILSTNNGNADNKAFMVFSSGGYGSGNITPSSGGEATVLSATGTLQTGDQTFATPATADKFALIGNPYPSPVDFDLFRQDNTGSNTIPSFWYFDPTLNATGSYVTVSWDGVGDSYTITPAGTRHIQSGQAIFMKTTASGSNAVIFKEAQKSTNDEPSLFRTADNGIEKLAVQLKIKNNADTLLADAVTAAFHSNFSTAVIAAEDIDKFYWSNEQIALKRNNKDLSIERRPYVQQADTLYLHLTGLQQGKQYMFATLPINFDNTVVEAYLNDSYLNTSVPISLAAEQHIGFTVNSNTASQAANRFYVVFRNQGGLPLSFVALNAAKKEQGVMINWTTANEENIQQHAVEKSADAINFKTIGTVEAKNTATANYELFDAVPFNGDNYYRIKTTEKDGKINFSKVVKVNFHQRGLVQVSPNPVKNNLVKISLSGVSEGTYRASIYNSFGQKVYEGVINHTTPDGKYTINTKQLSSGMYSIVLQHTTATYTTNFIHE